MHSYLDKDVASIVEDICNTREVSDNKGNKMSIKQALAEKLINMALQGDLKAMKLIVELTGESFI